MNRVVLATKSALVAAFIGGSIGVTVQTYRRDSNRAKQLLIYATTAGVSGLLVGYTVGSVRRLSGYSHILSFGGNFFAISATFLVYRESILVKFGRGGKQLYADKSTNSIAGIASPSASPIFASAASGGLTGFVLSTIFWHGPKVLIINSIQGIGLGIIGQFIYDKYYAWRLKKVLEYNYPELTGNVNQVQDGSDLEENVHWSEYLKRFLSRRTYSSQVDEEIRNMEIQLELLEEEKIRLQSDSQKKEE